MKKLSVLLVFFLMAVVYFFLRRTAGEAIQGDIILTAFLLGDWLMIRFCLRIDELSQLHRLLKLRMKLWVAAAMSIAFGIVGVSYGRPLPMALLDAFFAFSGYIAFFSIGVRFSHGKPKLTQEKDTQTQIAAQNGTTQ